MPWAQLPRLPSLLLLPSLLVLQHPVAQARRGRHARTVLGMQPSSPPSGSGAAGRTALLEPRVEVLSVESPRAMRIHGLLSEEECDELIAFGMSKLRPAEVVTEAGRDNWDKRGRTVPGSMLQPQMREPIDQAADLAHDKVHGG